MIQRIQSIYLLLTTLLPALFIKGSFLRFINNSGSEIYINLKGLWQSSVTGNDELLMRLEVLSGLPILILILSITAIFLFKKRKIQLKLAAAIILLTIVHIGLMVYYILWVTGKFQAELVPVFRMFIPVLILIFGILAYMGIRKDENLVKSLDRLR